LRIGKAKWSGEYLCVGGCVEAGVEFPDALSCFEMVRVVGFSQVSGLMFQVVETRIRREVSDWHDELPFECPGPHV
jgi:hypothetical protein